MRISSLEIQAFGPFAERQRVDFDALSAQGLFLLNGPTGAGKSSVLDAVCYALYGSLPGTRSGAKRLRSDHAPEGLAPEVEMEFTVGVRRFRVSRSPQWERPSKRGGGTTTEQARVLLSELRDGDWVQLSARNDEAGLEILDLLGMDKEQFTRVVMLAQGEFAAFLKSDAKSRGALLQRLFATDRFEKIENLLHESAHKAASALAAAQEAQHRTVERAIDEARRHGIAGASDGDGTAVPAGGDGGPAALQPLLEQLKAKHAAAKDSAARSAGLLVEEKERSAALSAARRRATALARLRADEEAHAAERTTVELRRAALDRHQLAQVLEGVLSAAEEAEGEHQLCLGQWSEALGALRVDPAALEYLAGAAADPVMEPAGAEAADPDARELAEAVNAVSSDLGALRAALPEEERLRGFSRRADELAADIEAFRGRDAELAGALAVLASEKADLAKDLEEHRAGAALEGRRAELLETARQLESTIAEYGAADKRRAEAERLYSAAHEEHLALKELWLEKLQLRLEQAAVELAAQLEDGEPCAVCGSPEHPAPALTDGTALVTHDIEQAARRSAADAEARLNQARAARDAAVLETAGLAARGGSGDAGAARDAAAVAAAQLREAQDARRAADSASARLDEVTAKERELSTQQEAARQDAADAAVQLRGVQEQADELTQRLKGYRGTHETLAARVEALRETHRLLIRSREALEAADRSAQRTDRSARALAQALDGSSFAAASDIREALLGPATLAEYRESVRSYEATAHRLALEAEGDEIAAALDDERRGLSIPSDAEVEALTRAHEALAEQARSEDLAAGLLGHSVAQLEELSATFAEQEAAVGPLREKHALQQAVADSARGGGENLYKMSLSTYVLASRLEQVAEAATERLLAMSDGRYALVHSDALAGNRKAGLGLSVVDGWTGNRRDTSTLSGGESFMASLAMALGLADVVQQEAGGLEIETLFVDEGFGSLDDQALEQVMDALEGLRSGGRVVGLVSHVAELKQRIPVQLQVLKGRQGSTLRFVEDLAAI